MKHFIVVALLSVGLVAGVASGAPKPTVSFTLRVTAEGTDRVYATIDAKRANGTTIKSFTIGTGKPETSKFMIGSPLAEFCVVDVSPGYSRPEPDCIAGSVPRRRVARGPSLVGWTLTKTEKPVTRSRPRVRIRLHDNSTLDLTRQWVYGMEFRGPCTGLGPNGNDPVQAEVWGPNAQEAHPVETTKAGRPWLELVDDQPCTAQVLYYADGVRLNPGGPRYLGTYPEGPHWFLSGSNYLIEFIVLRYG